MRVQLATDLFSLWKKAPALEIALFLYIGASSLSISPYGFAAIALVLAYLSSFCFEDKRQLIYVITLMILGACYMYYFSPHIPAELSSGKALLQITEKKEATYFGKTSLCYKVLLLRLETEEGAVYENIPCYLSFKKPLDSNYLYYVNPLTIIPDARGSIRCKISKEAFYKEVKPLFSLTEWRYQQKQQALQHLHDYIDDVKVLKLLSALSVGYLDHKALRYEFSKTGLQHLLTISGFHFALLTLFCAFFLKWFLPKRLKASVLIALLGLYVIYLGPAPSVSRAWIAILVYLIGEMFDIPCSGLNSLGVAGCLAFISNPLDITQLGFQLSYAATLGILAFYSRYEEWLCLLIPRRTLPHVLSMPKIEQGLYYLLTLIRKGVALDLAVNSLTLPILLCHFGSFPIMSLLYNLIVPILFTVTMFLLLLGFTCSFWPLVCGWIHGCNEQFTSLLLSFIATIPSRLHLTVYLPPLSGTHTLLLLWTIFLAQIYNTSNKGEPYGIFKTPVAVTHKA